MHKLLLALATAMALLSSPLQAATLLDDFNDTDGSNWTVGQGTTTHNGSTLTGSNFAMTYLNGVTATTVSVEISVPTQGFVAILFENALGRDLYLKAQNNGSGATGVNAFGFYNDQHSTFTGVYDGVMFNMFDQLSGSGILTASIANGAVTMTYDGFSMTRDLLIDVEVTRIGLAFWGGATANAIYEGIPTSEVPLPAGGALLAAALGAIGLLRRRGVKAV